MAEEFSWRDLDEAELVIPSTQAVAVYLNPNNEVVIRQERSWDEEEDKIIVVPKAYAKALVDRLAALLVNPK